MIKGCIMLYLKEENGTVYYKYIENRDIIDANKLWDSWNKIGNVQYSDFDKWPKSISQCLKNFYNFFENEFSAEIDILPDIIFRTSIFDVNNKEICVYDGNIEKCSFLVNTYRKINNNITVEKYVHRGFSVRIKCFGEIYDASNINLIDAFRELKNKLSCYGAHQRVLICCREELLVDDYFHAVQEAVKGICDRVREMSGLLTDGNELIQTAFSVKNPYIVLNSLRTTSEQNQQNGLKEIILGLIHMVRNVTAHELRIRWDINENDAIDILQQVSFVHKYMDQCIPVRHLT